MNSNEGWIINFLINLLQATDGFKANIFSKEDVPLIKVKTLF